MIFCLEILSKWVHDCQPAVAFESTIFDAHCELSALYLGGLCITMLCCVT